MMSESGMNPHSLIKRALRAGRARLPTRGAGQGAAQPLLVFARQDARIQVSGEAREGRTGASSSQCGPGWSLLRVALPGSAVHAQNTVLPPPLRVDRARATGQGYVRPAGGWGACRVEGPG